MNKAFLVFVSAVLILLVGVGVVIVGGAGVDAKILSIVYVSSYVMTVGLTAGAIFMGRNFKGTTGYFYLGGALFKFFGYLVLFLVLNIEDEMSKKYFLVSVLSSYVICQVFSVIFVLKQLKRS